MNNYIITGAIRRSATELIEDGLVHVYGGTIVYSGTRTGHPADELPPHPEALGIAGGFICPGLFDAHVHLVCSGGHEVGSDFDPRDDVGNALTAYGNALQHVFAGVTAVRDLAAPDFSAIRLRAFLDDRELGPKIIAHGKSATSPGGHLRALSSEVADGEALLSHIEEMASAGATGLTLILSSPGGTFSRAAADTNLTDDELAEAISYARARGMAVTAHATTRKHAISAVSAGVGSIERGSQLDPETLDMMAKRGVWLTTQRLWVLRNTPNQADQHWAVLKKALELGVKVAIGTDGGATNMPHGRAVAEACKLVEEGVMTSPQALDACTASLSGLLGVKSDSGLQKGKYANLIVTEGDPAMDIHALTQIKWVISRGMILRASLSSGRNEPDGRS